MEEYKEYKTFDENDVLLTLNGIKDILLFFLNFEYNNNEEITKRKRENIILSHSPLNAFKKIKSKTLNLPSKSSLFNIITYNAVTDNLNIFDVNWIDFKKNLIDSQKTNTTKNYFFIITDNKNASDKEEDISLIPKNLYTNKIFSLLNSLILTWVNQSDRYEVYDYCLNINGILAPTEINSWNNISNIELESTKEIINKNPIKNIIIEIAFNIFSSNPILFIEKILDIWCFGQKGLSENLSKINACIDKQFQLSIIELFIV